MIRIIKKELNLVDKPCLIGLPGAPDGGTSGVIVFEKDTPEPLAFIKIFRDRNDERLKREAELLKLLVSKRNSIYGNLPEYLFSHSNLTAGFLGQTLVPGDPLIIKEDGDYFCKEDFENKLAKICNFLVSLAKANNNNNSPSFRPINLEIDLNLIEDGEYVADIVNNKQVIEHGDFVQHNILIDNGTLGVIDWSDCNLRGTPLFDYYNFVLNAFFRLRRSSHSSDFLSLFKYAFFEDNHFSHLIREKSHLYLDELGIKKRAANPLFTLFIESYWRRERDKIKKAQLEGYIPSYLYKLNYKNADPSRGIFGVLKEFINQNQMQSIL